MDLYQGYLDNLTADELLKEVHSLMQEIQSTSLSYKLFMKGTACLKIIRHRLGHTGKPAHNIMDLIEERLHLQKEALEYAQPLQ